MTEWPYKRYKRIAAHREPEPLGQPFVFDDKLGVLQLNRTALDESISYRTWENGGIYTEYSYYLVNRYGRPLGVDATLTPRISQYLRSHNFKPTLIQYLLWNVRRVFLLSKRYECIK